MRSNKDILASTREQRTLDNRMVIVLIVGRKVARKARDCKILRSYLKSTFMNDPSIPLVSNTTNIQGR